MTINSIISASGNQSQEKKATTIGGRYTVGDTRTMPVGKIIPDNEYGDWQKGFDRIDVAPKDGQLSLEEICAHRDKQVLHAILKHCNNPKNWLNVKKLSNLINKVMDAERETAKYMEK